MSNTGEKVTRAAFLVENGFCERELEQAWDALNKIGIHCRIVTLSNNLVRSWNELKDRTQSNWGKDYAPDSMLENTLPTDYDVLVLPGGRRSVDKLSIDPHVHTFLKSFFQARKPVIAYNSAIEVLAESDVLVGYSVATRDHSCDEVKSLGGRCASSNFVVSKNLISMTRYIDVEGNIQRAVQCILKGEQYFDKVVGLDNLPNPHKAA